MMSARPLVVVLCVAMLLRLSAIAAAQAAAPAPPVSLDDVVALALAHNRQIQSVRLSLELARLSLRSTRASYFSASLNGEGLHRREVRFDETSRNDSFGSAIALSRRLFTGAVASVDATSGLNASPGLGGDRVGHSYNISLSQPLLRGFGSTVTNAPLVQSQNELTIAADQLAQTMMDTIVRVESGYWNLLLQAEAVKIQAAALERSRRLKATTEALIAAGRVARNELVRAEADIAAQEVALATAEESQRRAENQLRETLDTDFAGPIVPIQPAAIDPRPADRLVSLDLAFLNRPDWKSAQLGLQNSLLSVAVAKNARLYGIDVSGGITGRGGADTFGSAFSRLSDQRSAALAVTVDVPLNNTQNVVTALAARIAHQLREIQVEEQRQQIELEVDDAVNGVNLQIRQLELTRRARGLAEQALEVELEKLRAGRSTNFNVVQLQNDVKLALNAELQARIGYLNARSALERTTGTALQHRNVTVQ
jgi:outer membrane protein TolC